MRIYTNKPIDMLSSHTAINPNVSIVLDSKRMNDQVCRATVNELLMSGLFVSFLCCFFLP